MVNSIAEICRHPPAMASRESDFWQKNAGWTQAEGKNGSDGHGAQRPSARIWARRRANSSWLSSLGMAWQICSKPGKFHRFGKSRHCCGLTGWTAQSSPARKTHPPSGLSCKANPWRSCRNRVKRWMNSYSPRPWKSASRVISASVNRTCPGQRQQAVQR